MKKLISVIALMTLLMLSTSVMAQTATDGVTPVPTATITPTPDNSIFSALSGDYTLLANPVNKWKLFSAPSINYQIASTLNDIVTLSAKAAFMTSANNGDNANKTVLLGPWIGINPVKIISASPKIKITKDFNLFAGLGVLVNFIGLDGIEIRDIKKLIYPGGSIGVSF